ncbi:long-chain-fatty-acid--CoA ligase 5-like isoform X2 [Xenia sp. Carnegie-2017]|nr:long-chain-fatty-acid--CoA ligase 5-like isoform X2 [Xenia sp. Carnegie-2017]
MELGYKPSTEMTFGIYAVNKLEWMLMDRACVMFSFVSVPLYESLGVEACIYIINHAELSLVVCDENKLPILLESFHQCPKLKHIIKIGDMTKDERENFKKLGINVKSFEDVMLMGHWNPWKMSPAKPDDVYTICFTSGTTGQPKGVMLSNKNMISCLAATFIHFEKNGYPVDSSFVHISYLPLPHMYERLVMMIICCAGGRGGFFRGDVKLLLDDIQLLRPTFFASVPRLLNRLYDKVISNIESSSGLKKCLFYKAFESKRADLKKGQISKNTLWDKIVFHKIQAILGGNVNVILTGAAPIDGKVLEFLRVVLGCLIFEGYGQTESTALVSLTNKLDLSPGHVGSPSACNYVKLVDVPEMDYFTSNNQGEICVYGPNVFKGYLKNPEKTSEMLDDDGWLHTGDVGEWKQNGTLKIIGRKKCIFKLLQGEYISPDKIENVYIKCPFVAQAFVHGSSLKSFLVGIIVPDEEILTKWAKDNNINKCFEELCQDTAVNYMILNDIISRGNEAKLTSFEQVKGIHLHSQLFTPDNGLLTPTLKSKRFTLAKRFNDEIGRLYEKLEKIPAKPKL